MWKPGTVLNDPKNHGDRFLIPIMTQGVILKDKLLNGVRPKKKNYPSIVKNNKGAQILIYNPQLPPKKW